MKRIATAMFFLIVSVSSASAAEQTISEHQRVEAIWYSYGLGCAVQDRSTERAMAWTQGALGIEAALIEYASLKAASEWVAIFNSAEVNARAKGGFRCEKVTAFPSSPPQELFQN